MEEYIDILDQKGNQTGKTKLKSQAHKDGGLHKSAHIWIINSQNKLLIQKRAPDNDCYQNTWDISSAGHLAAGEQSIDSAIREIDEELGLKLKKENLEYLFSLTCNQITNKGTFINRCLFG